MLRHQSEISKPGTRERASDCFASLRRSSIARLAAAAAAGDKYRFEAKSIAAKGSEEIREGEKEERKKRGREGDREES